MDKGQQTTDTGWVAEMVNEIKARGRRTSCLDTETREWMLRIIKESLPQYGDYRCITVARMRAELDQWGTRPEAYRYAPTKDRNSWTRSILASLVRSGYAVASIGIGDNGREARCYERAQEAGR